MPLSARWQLALLRAKLARAQRLSVLGVAVTATILSPFQTVVTYRCCCCCLLGCSSNLCDDTGAHLGLLALRCSSSLDAATPRSVCYQLSCAWCAFDGCAGCFIVSCGMDGWAGGGVGRGKWVWNRVYLFTLGNVTTERELCIH